MRTIHDLHKLPKTDNTPVPKNTMLKISDLPRRKVKAPPKNPNPEPQKILTISDLPRRKVAMQRQPVVSRREIRKEVQGKHRNLGPKTFADYVRNNAWAGRRCFIVGGGPSVKNEDLSLLRGELTIGINRAYEIFSPNILFGVDGQMWGWAEQGKLGAESKQKILDYRGYKVWMAIKHKLFPPDYYLIDADDRGGYRIGTTKMLCFKNNSGYGAINLAAALGANPIYLLGFDMQGNKEGKQKWWHNGYPIDYGEDVYPAYIREITAFAPVLKSSGFEVINLNPKSALKCFSFGDYKKVAAKKPLIPQGSIQIMANPGIITAITPTGDRPLAFALCKHWMEQQTVHPDQWLVIDDGKVPLKPTTMMDYVRRSPKHNDPPHTLNINLSVALPHIKGEKIIIIEDDEYYAPTYIETMAKELDKHEVAGIMKSKYYHLPTGGYMQIGNTTHASLAQTAFRDSFLSDFRNLSSKEKTMYLDMRIWKHVMPTGRGFLLDDDKKSLYTGIKGLPGRKGIGQGHKPSIYGKSMDTKRTVLKNWITKDYGAYMDILSGKLTGETCSAYFPRITGITVCQNTKELTERSYTSVRKLHPDMPIIIIDGSDPKDPCALYAKSLQSNITTVHSLGYNIGHGKGMCMGIDKARTPYALIFDSDIEMLKSPVDGMLGMMEPNTFGVGWIEHTDYDGFGVGARKAHIGESMPYLHPYFQLINIANYHKYHPYVHHGAPCYLTMLDIYKQDLSNKVLKEFPGLGHTSGKDYGWEGKPSQWVRHDVRGTRDARAKKGLPQIEANWVNNQGKV